MPGPSGWRLHATAAADGDEFVKSGGGGLFAAMVGTGNKLNVAVMSPVLHIRIFRIDNLKPAIRP
jgi:hypothetical protein